MILIIAEPSKRNLNIKKNKIKRKEWIEEGDWKMKSKMLRKMTKVIVISVVVCRVCYSL